MSPPQNLRAIGDEIERLLGELEASADPVSFHRAQDALRLVSELYGAGLARVMALAADADPGMLDALVRDDLVASLLVVHGLHPDSLADRVEAALGSVRPLLATHAGDVEVLEVDPAAGSVRIKLLGSCDGCPSSAVTLQLAVERAITEAAPEVASIVVDGQDRPVEPREPREPGAAPRAGRAGAPGAAPAAPAAPAGKVPVLLGTKPCAVPVCPTELATELATELPASTGMAVGR